MESNTKNKYVILKKILPIILAIGMLFSQFVVFAQEDEYAGKIVILQSNDVHGAISCYANMAGLKTEFESKGAKVILADIGDFSQGSMYVNINKGKDAVDMMNLVGYDLATLGNHEFDYGYEQLTGNLSNANFKTLCANAFDSLYNMIGEPRIVIEKEGVKIGFFGLATPETRTHANPAMVGGLTFLGNSEMYEAAQEQIDELKNEGADLVICLSHLGVDNSSIPNRSYELLENTTGIDFVLDGHSHTVMTEGVNGEKIQSTGEKFANVGVVVIDGKTKQIDSNYLIPVDENTPSDKTVADAAQKIIDAVDEEYEKVFAKSEVDLNGDRVPNGNRDSETNLGDLITDSIRWSISRDASYLGVPMEDVVVLENGGGIRAWIRKGDITKRAVNEVLPFQNTICVSYVTGETLLEVLEASTFDTPYELGAFPQTAGMKYTIDTTKEYDPNPEPYPNSTYYGPASINRVTIDNINGLEFDPHKIYAVVTNDFCSAGGDTYYALTTASEKFDTGIQLDETLMEFITTELNGVIPYETYGKPQGRISVLGVCQHKNTQRQGVVEATCTEGGFTGNLVCTDCGVIIEKGEETAALGHDYDSSGICTRCHVAKETAESDVEPTNNNNNNNIPKTGDNSNVLLYVVICAAVLAGGGLTFKISKRKS